jgi:hypothetical protein
VDEVLLLEQIAQGGEARLIDDRGALLGADRGEQLPDGLRGPLDRLLDDRDPLEQVLVEREGVLFRLGIENAILFRQPAGDDEELLVAAPAVVLILGVAGSAGLTQDRLVATAGSGAEGRRIAQT